MVIFDEEININSQEVALDEGVYQWMVKGKNFGYQTEINRIFNLTVASDTSLSLVGRSILTLAPQPDYITNQTMIDFAWEALPNVDNYTFQVASPNFDNINSIQINEILNQTTYTVTLPEGVFQWRIRGENQISTSKWTENTIIIDITPPTTPQIVFPSNDEVVSLPVLLEWNSDINSSNDSILIYTDSLITPPIISTISNNNEYLFNDTSTTEYFWRVRSQDAAGNLSDYSELKKLIIL